LPTVLQTPTYETVGFCGTVRVSPTSYLYVATHQTIRPVMYDDAWSSTATGTGGTFRKPLLEAKKKEGRFGHLTSSPPHALAP
jgi:hypothetical protein